MCVCVCTGKEVVASSDIKVSDILIIEKVRGHNTQAYRASESLEVNIMLLAESAYSCGFDFAENDREEW